MYRMDNDHLNPEGHDEDEDDEDYIKPQMSYCCGSRGVDLSPKFIRDERTRGIFVGLAFVIKLVEITFIGFVVYDLAADGEDQLKFNFTFITAEKLKPYNWVVFPAAALVLVIYFAARCAGAGRGLCAGFLLNVIKTFGIGVFCGTLITFDCFYPHRYILVLSVITVGLICLGICLFTTLFEMNVLGRGMYSALFIYFLLIFLSAHFIYITTLRDKYQLDYVQFLTNVGVGGGSGLFIGMVMFWYLQELITGKVMSLHESEFVYVCLLF